MCEKTKSSQLSGSEAVYGFAGWLTSRSEKTTMSSSNDAAVIAELVDLFCQTNNLDEPRDKWSEWLKHPKNE